MNELIPTAGNGLTMTSLEISALVEKRHDNVKRTIETLAEQGVIVRPQIEDEPGTDAMGRPRTTQVYRFTGERGKRDSIIVVAQLCPEFTARLVDRWQELEARVVQSAIPQTLPEALRLAAEAIERNEKLALENKAQAEALAEQAPQVEALRRIATFSDGSFCVRDAAKNLQVQEKRLRQWLSEHNWIYRRPMGSGWLAYSDKLKAGLLEHKITTGTKADGGEWTDTQLRVTSRGLAKLASLVPPEGGFFPPPINGGSPRPHA